MSAPVNLRWTWEFADVLTLLCRIKLQPDLLACESCLLTACICSCRLILSCSAGAFFLLVFAIFRGKIQVFRTRLVCPHQQDRMNYAFKHPVID